MRPRRLHWYVIIIAAAGAAVLATSARGLPAGLAGRLLAWTFLIGLCAGVEFADLSFRSPEGRLGLSRSEAILCPMIVGFPHPLAIWGTTIGIGIVQLARRRSEPIKAIFNVGQFACAAAVAAWLFGALEQPGPGFTLRDAGAAAAAMAAFSLVTHVLSLEAVALAGGRTLPTFSRDVVAASWNAGGGIALGLVLASSFEAARWTLVLFPVPLVFLYLGVRAVLHQQRERLRVEALHAASRALASSRELAVAVTGFLDAVAHVVDSSRALLVVEEDGQLRWSMIGPEGVRASLDRAEHGPGEVLLAAVRRAEHPIVITEDDPRPTSSVAEWLSVRNVAAVPLREAGEVIGCLAACDRTGAGEFGAAETQLLESLGHEVVLTLTAQRVSDQAAEHRQRFQRVFEDGPLGMAIVDPDLRLTVVNKALCSMLGYRPDELAGTSLVAITHPDDAWSDLHQARAALRGEIPGYQVEKRYVATDGAIVPGSVTATVVRDQAGNVLYGLHIIEDITERKRAEEALRTYAEDLAEANQELRQANELKDHFLAVTNHELRTPLTSILGFGSTLEQRWDALSDVDKRDFLGRIQRQATRLAALIEDLLTLSSAQAGALAVAMEPTAVEETIREAIRTVAAGEDDVVVRSEPGLMALADPDRLHRILTNYLSNALRHGAPPVSVEAFEHDGWIEIRVGDAGPGVPAHFVDRLFDEFAQADRATSRSHGGTGLGLAIVRELAQAHGGQAWYERGAGSGATFCVRLKTAAVNEVEHPDELRLSLRTG